MVGYTLGDTTPSMEGAMIPLSDDAPARKTPIVTVLLVLANTAIFLYQQYAAPQGAAELYNRLGCIPYRITSPEGLISGVGVPAPLTVVTALFLHGGWIHLAGNMLFLWIFGDNVEGRLGHLYYLVFFLATGTAATLVHVFLHPDSRVPLVGASGAIAGVMAAYMVFFPRARVKTLLFWFIFFQVVRVPAFVFLGYWAAVQVLAGLAQQGGAGAGVAWFAHVGGFGAGLAWACFKRMKGPG